MKTAEFTLSKALEEVWEWKRQACERTEGMSSEELMAHYEQVTQRALQDMNAELVRWPDGSLHFEKKPR